MSVKPTRPFRAHEVYAAACVGCGEEVESDTLPVPLRCPMCETKRAECVGSGRKESAA